MCIRDRCTFMYLLFFYYVVFQFFFIVFTLYVKLFIRVSISELFTHIKKYYLRVYANMFRCSIKTLNHRKYRKLNHILILQMNNFYFFVLIFQLLRKRMKRKGFFNYKYRWRIYFCSYNVLIFLGKKRFSKTYWTGRTMTKRCV